MPAPVSEAARARRLEVSTRLRQELATVWPRLTRTMDMGEIEEFARRLHGWAGEGELGGLARFAADLARDVDAFDVDQLPKTLQRFPAVCDSVFNHPPPGP